jgi:hypothetical protein
VHNFTAGARVTRDFGVIRGTIAADVEREIYGSAKLANGDKLSLSDRNFTEGTLTGRVGFEVSPALIPYLEASIGRSVYDDKRDSLGYERSSLNAWSVVPAWKSTSARSCVAISASAISAPPSTTAA